MAVTILFMGIVSVVSADFGVEADMEAFGKSQNGGFDAYKASVQDEFKTYKKIMDEEFNRYKKEISRYWEDCQMSGRTTWVDYSRDFRSRKIVDYENGIIRIEMVTKEKADPKKLDRVISKKLTELAEETTVSAFENDILSNRIEDRMVASLEDVKVTDSIAELPVASDMITGTDSPGKIEIVESIKELQKSAEIKEKKGTSPNQKIISVTIRIPDERLKLKASKYTENVEKYSLERKLDPALVFAIMQTESSFNPMAKSYIPAYGLMQIVPRSAGKDAAKLLYGTPKLLAPSFLYDCENNIKTGTAYLNVLKYRYLRAVKNEKSRQYCAIAAYNTGTGNVAKAFTGKVGMSDAAAVINKMKPDEVYNTLVEKLPYAETRNYMKKVTSRMKHYEKR